LHTFTDEGDYTVTLTVTNENGSDSTSMTINVLKAPDPSVPILPEAKFITNVTEGYVPLTVQFFDTSKNAASLCWNFGDGKSSYCPDPIHTFCCPGNYTVWLTARNDNGSSTTGIVITVLKPINQSIAEDNDPEGIEDQGLGRRNIGKRIDGVLNRENLDSAGDFILSFTGTRSAAELALLVEQEIFRTADLIKDLTADSVPEIELRDISMRELFLGFLGIALVLSIFRRKRK